jgi:hypothetical protein
MDSINDIPALRIICSSFRRLLRLIRHFFKKHRRLHHINRQQFKINFSNLTK